MGNLIIRCITIRISVHHHARSFLSRTLPITHNYFMIVCNTAYDRARRFLHQGAQAVVEVHGGKLPDTGALSPCTVFYNAYNYMLIMFIILCVSRRKAARHGCPLPLHFFL